MLPAGVTEAAAALLVCASFFTSALTAAFGVGGGVALLVIMGYLLPVAALVPVHGVVQWASNAGRMAVQREFIAWPAVIPFLIGSAAGALAGAPFVTQVDDPALKIALGIFIIAVTWARLPALSRGGPAVMAAGGAGTTFLSMFFGATGPLTAAFFAKAFDDRRAYIASHAAAMTFQHGFKVIAFMTAGFAFFQWLPLMAAMMASGYLGTLAGSKLLLAIPEKRFRLVFSIVITVLALDLVRRGLSDWIN
jgi:uncharacterized membrane protein YfcA